MYYFFRADASSIIGTGHINRCLTLAKKLGDKCIFICTNNDGNFIEHIKSCGYVVETIIPDKKPHGASNNVHASWLGGSYINDAKQTSEIIAKYTGPKTLIIDHYAIAKPWQQLLREHVSYIAVIDDLADREHDCDILLDSNFYIGQQDRYGKLVPAKCKLLLGIKYALLRDEFALAPRRKRTHIKNILVFLGGVDLENHTKEAIININDKNLNVIVLVGKTNPHSKEIKEICNEKGFVFKNFTPNIAHLMAWADLAIGAGGTTTWERIALGLPCITYCIAHNQQKLTNDVIKLKLALPAGTKITDIHNIEELSVNCLKKSYLNGALAAANALKSLPIS